MRAQCQVWAAMCLQCSLTLLPAHPASFRPAPSASCGAPRRKPRSSRPPAHMNDGDVTETSKEFPGPAKHVCIYIYIYVLSRSNHCQLHPAAVRCAMVLHQAFRARHVRKTGIGGEVRHGVTSGASCETSFNTHVTPHLHREYPAKMPCENALVRRPSSRPAAMGVQFRYARNVNPPKVGTSRK